MAAADTVTPVGTTLASDKFYVSHQSPMGYYMQVKGHLESHVPELGEYGKTVRKVLERNKAWQHLTGDVKQGTLREDIDRFFQDSVPVSRWLNSRVWLTQLDTPVVPPLVEIRAEDLLCAAHFVAHYNATRQMLQQAKGGDQGDQIVRMVTGGGSKGVKDPYEGLRFDVTWEVRLLNPDEHIKPSPTPEILCAAIDGSLFLRTSRIPPLLDSVFFSTRSHYAALTHDSRVELFRAGKTLTPPYVLRVDNESHAPLQTPDTKDSKITPGIYSTADVRQLIKYLQERFETARQITQITRGENY